MKDFNILFFLRMKRPQMEYLVGSKTEQAEVVLKPII